MRARVASSWHAMCVVVLVVLRARVSCEVCGLTLRSAWSASRDPHGLGDGTHISCAGSAAPSSRTAFCDVLNEKSFTITLHIRYFMKADVERERGATPERPGSPTGRPTRSRPARPLDETAGRGAPGPAP